MKRVFQILNQAEPSPQVQGSSNGMNDKPRNSTNITSPQSLTIVSSDIPKKSRYIHHLLGFPVNLEVIRKDNRISKEVATAVIKYLKENHLVFSVNH